MRGRWHLTLAALGAVALLFLLTPSSAAAEFSRRDWRYFKSLGLPTDLQRDALVELLPDPEVFAGSAIGLVDLRIIADEDREVPYKVEVNRADRQRTSLPLTIRDKGYVPGQYNTFIADLGREGILHNEIEVRTASTNFRRKATVESSTDGNNWAKLAEQPVYDFTVKERNFSTRDTHLRYPDTTARYLRVRIADQGEGEVEIAGAVTFFVKETLAREVAWPVSLVNTSLDRQRRATLVEVDLGVSRLPSSRLAVRVTDVNFHRQLTVEASADRQEWATVQSTASIYAYDTPKFVGKSLGVTYPETASRYLRLVIHDEDSPPLTVEGVDVWGLQHRLVFTANPADSYKLYYGNAEAGRPSYDIETVFAYLVTEGLPQAKLGPQAPNPGFVAKEPPVSERLPWLFPAAVAVAAVLVAFLLYGIIRQARKVLPPPAQ